MMNYVSACSPNDVKTFVDTAPRPVVAAMRQTVANIVGSLPSAYFEVKVSTVRYTAVLHCTQHGHV